MKLQETYRIFSELLSSIDVAFCIYDAKDCAVIWNATFIRFFPEHDGKIHPGEPYRDNLERFYIDRLPPHERQNIERYIDEGVDRHRAQSRPFIFNHHGRRLRVGSLPLPDGSRVRMWHEVGDLAHGLWAPDIGAAEFPIDLLEYLADGAMVLDQHDRIIATNREFRELYDVKGSRSVVGLTLQHVVREAWLGAGESERAEHLRMLDSMSFDGAPFEVELPGGRWRRIIARRTSRGIGYFTHSDISQLKRALSDVSAMAATDGLTGLANRRRFDQVFEEEWHRRKRDGTDISLMLIDIDHFKLVNDRFGHIIGDDCLRRVARVVREALPRSGDLAARHGGEEFAVLLPDTSLEVAVTVAGTIRHLLAQERWSEVHPELKTVTASFGLCCGTPATGAGMMDFVRLADTALYRAKRDGRDRIEAEPLSGPLR